MYISALDVKNIVEETPSGSGSNSALTFFYDHNEGEWITGPSLMQARLNHAAGIITDDVTDEPLVVVTGGRTGGRNYSDGWFYLNSTEILQDGEWVQGKIINTVCHLLKQNCFSKQCFLSSFFYIR